MKRLCKFEIRDLSIEEIVRLSSRRTPKLPHDIRCQCQHASFPVSVAQLAEFTETAEEVLDQFVGGADGNTGDEQ